MHDKPCILVTFCTHWNETEGAAVKIALVTGGTGTIGREVCGQLLEDGCHVVANCHPSDLAAAEAWAKPLRAKRVPLEVWPFDVTDHEAVAKAIQDISDQIGPIDILVNAAGITRDASLRKLTLEDWDAVIRTNLDSVYHATRSVLEGMVERGFGRVINISSVNGQRGQFGQTNYSAAKAGMHGFTMALARELGAKGITVNSVSPGYIESPLTKAVPEQVREEILADIPVGRFGQPQEVASVVSFLAAEDASYITGANIPINGGYHMN